MSSKKQFTYNEKNYNFLIVVFIEGGNSSTKNIALKRYTAAVRSIKRVIITIVRL